jgi:SOS-response transcriptional repressor LexA
MQVNLAKSTLCAKEVEFLGFLLKETGYQPTKKRIEAILNIAPPKNVKKVREFLGAINFIKNHIPNRAGILAPITHLTKKDVPFIWGEEASEAFDKVKAEIANAILCTYPNPNKQFIIYPNTSQKYAMGAMLTQEVLNK